MRCPVGVKQDLQNLFASPVAEGCADLGHPGHHLDSRPHGVFYELHIVADLAGSAWQQLHEKVGQGRFFVRVATQHDHRLGGITGQGVQAVHSGNNVDQRALHVGFQAKLQVDPALSRIGNGGHFLEARQTAQHRFDGLDDLRFDFPRRRGPPAGLYGYFRVFDIRE